MQRGVIISIIIFIIGFSYVRAENSDTLNIPAKEIVSFECDFFYSYILNNSFYGGQFATKYVISPHVHCGFSLIGLVPGASFRDAFQYVVKEPGFTIGGVSATADYRWKKGNLNGMFTFDLGELSAVLFDDAVIESYTYYTRNGQLNTGYYTKEVAENNYLLLMPGVAVNQNISRNIYLTEQIKYRQLIGHSNFSSANELSGLIYSFGLALKAWYPPKIRKKIIKKDYKNE